MRMYTSEEFKVWLCSVNTDPDITNFLFTGIWSWLTLGSYSFQIDTSVHPTLYYDFWRQRLIGWEALLYGFVASGIITQQHIYYTTLGSRKTGNRWGTDLLIRMWTIIWTHWIHMNHALYETDTLARLNGVDELLTAVQKEYELWLRWNDLGLHFILSNISWIHFGEANCLHS